MSSFNRRNFLLLAAAGPTLAACGFEPTYGAKGASSHLLSQVVVDAPSNNETYLLVRELEDRLGRVSEGKYGLTTSIDTSEKSVGRTVQGVTSRYDVIGNVTYALRDTATGEVLTSSKLTNYVGYSATGTSVATLSAEEDAYARLMSILADQIMTDLWAWSAQNAS